MVDWKKESQYAREHILTLVNTILKKMYQL